MESKHSQSFWLAENSAAMGLAKLFFKKYEESLFIEKIITAKKIFSKMISGVFTHPLLEKINIALLRIYSTEAVHNSVLVKKSLEVVELVSEKFFLKISETARQSIFNKIFSGLEKKPVKYIATILLAVSLANIASAVVLYDKSFFFERIAFLSFLAVFFALCTRVDCSFEQLKENSIAARIAGEWWQEQKTAKF